MIYVDTGKLVLPKDWQAQAETAKQVVDAAEDKLRSEAIDNNSHIWGNLKDAYGEISGDKCWYADGTRNVVLLGEKDHFFR
jgi:hypothetical protein